MAMLPLQFINAQVMEDDITLEVMIIDPTDPFPNTHKSPVVIPHVSIDDYTLHFESGHSDYTLALLDEDGYVVYTTYVSSSVSSVVLPSTLSGEFEIRLIPDDSNYYFYRYIEL